MSKIYLCEYEDGDIKLKRIFNEEDEDTANKYAQKLSGGVSAKITTNSFRDGQKIYQVISFSSKENKGAFCIKNNKTLRLNRSKLVDSLKENLPDDVKKYLTELTKCSLIENSNNIKQENFIKSLFCF